VDDEPQPGIVACEFVDAEGKIHTLIDKVPIFSAQRLDGTSTYPQTGGVRCEMLTRWKDPRGRDLARITLECLFDDAALEVTVLAEQLS
jgi:hypothetical protein